MTRLLPTVHAQIPPEPVEMTQGRGEPYLGDPDGPAGNHGEVTCAVCQQPGWLMDADDNGFRIVHPGRHFACRAPR